MTHLSLCSGIGGLDLPLGVPDVFYETDPAPSEVLAERFPDVPNGGDWTLLDAFPASTSLITGGLPCQPVSGAGRGRGADDERYLFDDFVRILRSGDVRPTLVLENVRGILYPRHGRIFWRLVSALADLGYVGRWEVVRASDAGMPHRRERWFCIARHPDGERIERGRPCDPGRDEPADAGVTSPHPDSEPAGRVGGTASRPQGPDARRGEPADGQRPANGALSALRASEYGPAVARWEALSRPCPAPLDDRARLNPPFVEWMMGFPDGWVTDILPRTKALKALGNAVAPPQAALALAVLTDDEGVADAA